MGKLFIGVVALILISLAAIGLKALWLPVHTIKKGVDMGYDVVDKTMDGEKAIANYEWFKNQEQQIKVLGNQMNRSLEELNDFKATLSNDRKEWDMYDKDEYSRLRSNVTGIGQMLDAAIGDYNAKSSMVNRSVFKDNLPTNISRAMYVSKKMITQ